MSTLTVYPDASSGATTVDGFITSGYQSTIALAHAVTTGDGASTISPYTPKCVLVRALHNGSGFYLGRAFFLFDTAAIPDGASISGAVLSLFGDAFAYINNTSSNVDIVATNPASNNNLVAGDFGNCSFTSFASIAQSSLSQSAYNDFTLNASGITNISKTGISKFGAISKLDLDQTTFGSVQDNVMAFLEADYTGTSSDPKLVVTYSTTSIKTFDGLAIASVKTVNGLA